jgi:hypothetical protein
MQLLDPNETLKDHEDRIRLVESAVIYLKAIAERDKENVPSFKIIMALIAIITTFANIVAEYAKRHLG